MSSSRFILIIAFIFCGHHGFAQGFAQPSKKPANSRNNISTMVANGQKNKPKPKPLPKNVWGIDTFLSPISVVTQGAHDELAKALFRLDYLDGVIDSSVHNFRNSAVDKDIVDLIMKAAQRAAVYFENETFDNNPTLNLNIKKKYLGTLTKHINTFCNSIYRKDYDFEKHKNFVVRFTEMAHAQKENRLEAYVLNNVDESSYELLPFFTKDTSLSRKFLNKVSVQMPYLLRYLSVSELSKLDGFCTIIEEWARTTPNKILIYSTSTSEEGRMVKQCTSEALQKIIALGDQSKNPLRAIAFLGQYKRGEISIDKIDQLCSDDNSYYKAIVALRLANEQEARNVIDRDIANFAKDYVGKVNELHDESEAVRFKCIEDLNPQELYYLCVLANSEIYTSSYLGIYKRLMQRLDKKTTIEFLNMVNYDRFRTFIKMCANYNTLDNFLSSMKKEEAQGLMSKFVNGLSTNNDVDLEGAVEVADCIGSIQDTAMLGFLQQQVTKAYADASSSNNLKAKNAYLILKSIFSTADTNATFGKSFSLPPINLVRCAYMFYDTAKTIYEQMFFYGDDDGKVGYRSFLGTFDQSKWTIDQTPQYWIVIKSKGTKVPFVIYANKPLTQPQDEEAQQKLITYLYEQNIHPTVLVHRGHSYHLESTIEAMNSDNKIIILGSCGGYHNLQEILQRSPDAHIISTKQVGAFAVNTPIINSVHNALSNGNDVQWDQIWTKLTANFAGNTRQKELFDDYVPPHKNLGALFLKAYAKLNEQP
jgi:hypothetical protein